MDKREYWTQQMDWAHEFMSTMVDYPIEECGEGLVSLEQAVDDAGVTVKFSESKLAGIHERVFYLRSGLIDSFIAAAKQMNDKGWTLLVEDGFRSREMQRDIALQERVFDIVLEKVVWELNGEKPDPDFMFKRMGALTAISPKTGTHMSGSAMDISVLKSDDLEEVDRGGPYIELSELTPMGSPFISETGAENRKEITRIMAENGFAAYPYEFWHYSMGDPYSEYLNESGKPGRYGPVDFDLETGEVTPIRNPKQPLHNLDDIKMKIIDKLSYNIY